MSTAKSMASSYLNGKRAGRAGLTPTGQHRFKSSACNLSSSPQGAKSAGATSSSARAKSTSMTNLSQQQQEPASQLAGGGPGRPASRNALDSIHNGMNARYAQVQSKVYLQNIKPAPSLGSKIPASPKRAATLGRPTVLGPASAPKTSASGQAAALQARLGQLEEQLRQAEGGAEARRQELERERQERQEQVGKLKLELEEKAAELERQSEEQHRKLLEAYELADQNRRSADLVLAESRQRDEEARKRRQELEQQLEELREFVQVKEEMGGKMVELREQLREERERYEQQLANLRQVFENEKISKDENCNYFSRQRPLADSSDSLARVAQLAPGCRKCGAGRSQLHRSEQDMYGSRMSTRVQESARSAWRAGKQFASSIITGGVSLSACRQLKRAKKSKREEAEVAQQQLPVPPARSPRAERRPQVEAAAAAAAAAADRATPLSQDEQHTSVVRVEVAPAAAAASQKPEGAAAHEPPDKIHVDPHSNKLTIVTKFAGPAAAREQQQSPESASSASSSSERSRCESSSSGRGTSEDANSTGEAAPESSLEAGDSPAKEAKASSPVERRHRRRSSLFKASKVFGAGSQTSLNKLRSFFAGSSSASADISSKEEQPMEHLESSRRRCLELARLATAAAAAAGGEPREPERGEN